MIMEVGDRVRIKWGMFRGRTAIITKIDYNTVTAEFEEPFILKKFEEFEVEYLLERKSSFKVIKAPKAKFDNLVEVL